MGGGRPMVLAVPVSYLILAARSSRSSVTESCCQSADRAAVRGEMAARDARDQGRDVAPLVAAADAHVLDTSQLDAEAAFSAALALIHTGQ